MHIKDQMCQEINKEMASQKEQLAKEITKKFEILQKRFDDRMEKYEKTTTNKEPVQYIKWNTVILSVTLSM